MNKIAENAKHMDRVRLAAKLLHDGIFKGAVKQVMREKYGITTSQVNKYISRARKYLVNQSNADRDEMRGVSLEFYRRIASDEKNEIRDRVKAQERVDKILGLDSPTQLNQFVSGKFQNKVVVSYEGNDWERQAVTDFETFQNAVIVATNASPD